MRQRRTNIEKMRVCECGVGEGNTEWERQREEEEGGREGVCCILVIAQTEAAGADRDGTNR